ncbi:DUF2716 domain-containing protein [Streptomyces sp. NPDC091387]|uniref:DUF2716 domain-containing protein n=1 Tax=Streptomyces sp. NPDC091387 TaxID=3365998 RepID=UPI00381A1CE0
MMESPVVELLETEYRRVWDRFYDEFTFRPSTSSFKWPAIKEPVASVTWSLAALDDDPEYDPYQMGSPALLVSPGAARL